MTMRTEIALLLLTMLFARSQGSNKCLEPQDRGTCDKYVKKYFYDKNSEKCLPFWYGSCGGNANRFDSLELCHQACITGRQDQDDTDDNDRNEIPENHILLEITNNVLSPVSDLCQLPKDSGPCTDFTKKWYFDSTLQECRRFWYGSCQGNDNRFDDSETCRRRCIKEAHSETLQVNKPDNTRQQDKPTTACEQPKDAGTCQEYVVHWYFDVNSAACRQFWYGGCGGNSNRFSSKDECEAKCIKGENQASTVRPAQPAVGCAHSKYGCCPDQQTSAEGPNYKGCTENCEDSVYGCCPDGVTQPGGPNQDGCEIGSGTVPCEQTKHGCCADGITTASGPSYKGCADTPDSERTPVGAQDKSTAAAPEKKCTAPVSKHKCKEFEVKWRFDSQSQECVRHWWGGCSDTDNVFDSKEACNTECKGTVVKTLIPSVSPKQAACTAPQSIALCAEKFALKWRFENTKQECVRHWWGGCGDNGNVFESEGDCEAVCMNTLVITNPDTVDPDFVNICDMEVDAGPCTDNIPRYYYDPRNRKCQIFYYGGCQGNENNFAGIEDCQRQCMGGVDISRTATSAAIPKPETSTSVTAAVRTTAEPDENVRSSIKMSGHSTAEKGSTIQIRCNAVGPTQPTEIEWFFNGRLITAEDSDVSINTLVNQQLKQALVSELVRKNFDQESAGTYYCRSRPYGDLDKMRITIVEERVTTVTPKSTDRRDPTAVCLMKAESGNCYASIPRYHYDHQSGHCLQFTYGGCGGNHNNFETLQECNHFCSDKEVCHQPREVGRCRAAEPRFYFDSQTRSCQNFIYGGCDGNLNNFATKEACDRKCHHFKGSSSHTDAAITSEDKDPHVCQLKPEQGTCRGYEIKWYYIPDRNRCTRFVYTGCGGNGNQFNSQEECSSKCLKVENTDNRGSWRQTVPTAPTSQSTVFYPKSSSAPRGAGGDYQLVLVKLGDTAVLTCPQRSGGVLWYRDRIALSSSSRIHVYDNGTLYLRNVTEDMAGLYNCRKIIGLRLHQVQNFRVQVYVPPKIVPAPDTVSMMPGKDVFVHCQALGTPEPVVSWNRGGHALRTSDRYSVFANGTLIIHNVHIQDAGEYECSADNDIAATSKTFRLSIKETIGADIQSHRGIYTEGETIELHCKGTGYPTPKLEWVKEGKELTTAGTISSVHGILTVTSATIEDAGMYKCIAFNEKGKAEDSTVVQIKLRNPFTKCEDNLGRTRCHLIVTGRLCGFRHFATHCCHSCRKAGFV